MTCRSEFLQKGFGFRCGQLTGCVRVVARSRFSSWAPLRTNVLPIGLSVPFTSGESERRLEIEQYSGEGCSAMRPRTLTGVWGVFVFGVATVAVHPLVPPVSEMAMLHQR
jgi:hypothetical protein